MLGIFILFTGLPCAGKSTLAQAVELRLGSSRRAVLFDGDALRREFSADLGFSLADRRKHLVRVGNLAKPLVDSGAVVLGALIAPMASDRAELGRIIGRRQFLEIYCHCPLEVCERRDVKGLYRRARKGEIEHFTGISSPYEPPISPALTLDTHMESIDSCAERVVHLVREREQMLSKDDRLYVGKVG